MNSYTTHALTVKARCQVDPSVEDEYEVSVDVPGGMVVQAEAVTEAVALCTTRPVAQETLTQKLADLLQCRVYSTGKHAGGVVETSCQREPSRPRVVDVRYVHTRHNMIEAFGLQAQETPEWVK